jgi:hypothetical protein
VRRLEILSTPPKAENRPVMVERRGKRAPLRRAPSEEGSTVTYSPLGTPGTPAGLGGQDTQAGGTASTAKDEAKGVGREAVGGAKQVAGTAKDQAANVAGEAKYQAKDLLGRARDEARQQASSQQQRAAQGIRTVADHLSGMAQSSESGVAQQVVQNVSERAHSVAGWLEQREPADVLDEVRGFAARRPGVFLAIAVGAGVVVGRLTKGLIAEARSGSGQGGTTGSYGQTGAYGAETVLPAYEPTEAPVYGGTTDPTITTPVAGPLGEGEISSTSVYGSSESATTYPEYGRRTGDDRI